MSDKHYVLTNCGNGDWFTLQTEDLGMVVDILDSKVCSLCKITQSEVLVRDEALGFEITPEQFQGDLNETFPDNWQDLPEEDKVELLLGTQCGANFTFSIYDSYEDMVKGEM